MVTNPILHDLDLMLMFRENQGYSFKFTTDSSGSTFMGKTQEELEFILGDYCSKVTVGRTMTTFFFIDKTPLEDMFIFRTKLNSTCT